MPSEYNPTRLNLTMRQVTSLYMAFLSLAAITSLDRARNVVVGEDIQRTLTMPAFKGKQDAHTRRELGLAAHFGWEIKEEFEDGLVSGFDLRVALPKLRGLERHASRYPPHNLEIVEPLAAIAARMATYDPQREDGRRLSMVIDVGAGTVDFGLFVSGLKGENIGVHPIADAKYSLPVGGNDIDTALIQCILQKARLRGNRRALVKASLEEQARDLKKNLLGADDNEPMRIADADIQLTKSEFVSSDPLRRIAERVEGAFWERLRSVDASWLELASMLFRRGIGVFLSGGGAKLPFLRSMIPENAPQTIHESPHFYFRVANEDPSWATERGFIRAWQQVGKDYPQMAVSLGGAVFGAGINQILDMGNELKEWGGAMRR